MYLGCYGENINGRSDEEFGWVLDTLSWSQFGGLKGNFFLVQQAPILTEGKELHVARRKGSLGRLGRSAGRCHLLQRVNSVIIEL